jgi:hypothetical protein
MALTRNRRTTNSSDNNNGRYVQGGLTDRFQNRLGWWERFPIKRQTDDIRFTLSKETEGRPDLVAHRVYKKATLMWLVLQYNNIVDINTEFVSGKTIVLPTPRRVQVSILSNTVGGNVIE